MKMRDDPGSRPRCAPRHPGSPEAMWLLSGDPEERFCAAPSSCRGGHDNPARGEVRRERSAAFGMTVKAATPHPRSGRRGPGHAARRRCGRMGRERRLSKQTPTYITQPKTPPPPQHQSTPPHPPQPTNTNPTKQPPPTYNHIPNHTPNNSSLHHNPPKPQQHLYNTQQNKRN